MTNLSISTHPLAAEALTGLRDRRTGGTEFRNTVSRISRILCYEATYDLATSEQHIQTPLENAAGFGLEKNIILVPVLRAGLGMVEAFLQMLPSAQVGHIGLYRDEETLQPVEYYSRYPEALHASTIILLDPMLATGGSASAAIRTLRDRGAGDIRLVCLLCAPEGVNRLAGEHPDVPIFTASLDRELNEHGYILPGLGDAGDRMFGTE